MLEVFAFIPSIQEEEADRSEWTWSQPDWMAK